MTDSAPAPQRVDVERFTPTIIYAGESPTGWFGDVEANANGEYVRHSEYAALLQQVAAQAAEIETRREDYATLAAMWKDDEAKYRARAEAAERAREEANKTWRGAFVGVVEAALIHDGMGRLEARVKANEQADRIAAFLAANGGDKP